MQYLHYALCERQTGPEIGGRSSLHTFCKLHLLTQYLHYALCERQRGPEIEGRSSLHTLYMRQHL
jgi:hypothetical protein